MNILYYGDNLDVLRRKIKEETVKLCYIDPPFNSKRNYNQIYNRIGTEDRAQAIAFTDTWVWDEHAISGYGEILANDHGRFQPQLIELIKGLQAVLGNGSLFAYLVSMSLRVTEIQRVLKPDGTLFLHCDPTASHYLKLVLDAIFVSQGGDYLNELAWCYSQGGRSKSWFPRKHDIIFWYAKGKKWTFNYQDIRVKYELLSEKSQTSFTKTDEEGRKYKEVYGSGKKNKLYTYYEDDGKIPSDWFTDIHQMTGRTAASGNEYLGYQTQKPEALLERLISAASDEGDMVLDAFCGCGTTVAVAQRLKRQWTGIDITYHSIALVLRRLERKFGKAILEKIATDGIPRDMKSAEALAHKKDDRLRKEFEKWAVLTYTNNRAIINEKKGADAGVDAIAYFMTGKNNNAKIIFQVKSGGVKRGDIATLRGDMGRERAALAILITLEEPSKPMIAEAKAAGQYRHESMARNYDTISIVSVRGIVEAQERLQIPMSIEVIAAAKREAKDQALEKELF